MSSHGHPHSKRKSTVRIPRDTAGRNLLLVLLVAFFAFIVTQIVVRMRERVIAPPRPPSVPAPVATPPPSLAPTAPPAPPPPPAATRERPPVEVSAPSRPVPAAAKGLGNPGAGPRRAQYPGRPMAQPPDHLKGELLPLNPPIEPYAP